MSFNNHDADDPIGNKYGKKNTVVEPEDKINGEAIKIYLSASTMPLKDFIKWYRVWIIERI